MTGRDRIVLIVVAVVAAIAGSWLLVIQPERKHAASLGTQVQGLQSQLSTARGQISQGMAARAQFSSDYTQLARLGEALPQDDNVPSLMYQVQNAAHGARVSFRTLQLVPGTSSSAPTPAPSTGSSSSSSASSSSSSSASTLPPGAALGTAGFPTEQFTFDFTGDFFQLSSFFKRLQQFVVAGKNSVSVSGRLISLNAISLAAGPKGFPQISATVSATTYMAPATTGLLNGATPAGPAGTTTTQAASGSSSSSAAPATITPPVR